MGKISSIKRIGIRDGGRGAAVLALFFAVILSCALFATAANADTQGDIVAQATKDFAAGQSLQDVMAHALSSAAGSDVAPENLAAALAGSLMQAGITNGADGVVLAGQIISAMLSALAAGGADTDTKLRTLAQMVEGIRPVSDSNGLNADAVHSQIIAAASSGDLGEQYAQVVNDAWTGRADTYTTLPAPKVQPPPPAPSPIAANVSNAFDPTASKTK